MLKLIKNRVFIIITVLLAQYFIGIGIIKGWLLAVAAGVILWYLTFLQIVKWPVKKYLSVIFAANMIFLISCTYWFTHISILGWSNIAGIGIKNWLIILLITCHALCSIIFAIYALLFRKVWHLLKIKPLSLASMLFFAYMLTIAEIIRSCSFAIITYGNHNAIGPVWGIFSIAPLSQTSVLHNIPALAGYWGTSYFIYAMTLVIPLFILRTRLRGAISTIIFISIILIYANISHHNKFTFKKEIQVVALSQSSNSDYLDNFLKIRIDAKKVNLIILPEYDQLMNPGFGLPSIATNYTRKPLILNRLNENSYIAGTQDAFFKDKRYAQNYLANNRGDYNRVHSKQFLIPGGEYVVGWITKLFNIFDPTAVQLFNKNRGRYVINNNAISQLGKEDVNTNLIASGSCSSVLSPYIFRHDLQKGAQVIALNISFAQFANSPEYKHFTENFMTFMASAYQRPVAAGVQDGQALFISPYNKEGLKQEDTIVADIPYNSRQTLYTTLGDFLIMFILSTVTLFVTIGPKRINYSLRKFNRLQNRRQTRNGIKPGT